MSDGLLLFIAVCVACVPVALAAIILMQRERGTAPRHWWEQ